MRFFHGTTKQNAEIIKATSLNESPFSVQDYIKHAIKENAGSIPKGFLDEDGNYNPVKWLGKGIYLFDKFNKREAISWCTRYGKPKHQLMDCTALSVSLKEIPEENIFDFFSYSDIMEIRTTLDKKLEEYLEEREDLSEQELSSYVYVQEAILANLENLFEGKQFLGGVAVDLYNLIQNNKIKLIRGIYKKGKLPNLYYDVYYCLKDGHFLEEFKVI
ncbi:MULTISPECIES: hypothetical protein [unclassified Paenibacillus]|uniref:hypothetical protein n=1 Tax=unclassified Paenibacillus TaxID=185978 RepID=UPI0024061DFD|nr:MULTISPECIES: hypothetical protein [unclassified Paenibacillus]MDF9844725.1 hypothetical protein [Paenibacillus sp. PastF-2]MDF9851327.1 hypothetical protein [Paenibacillus sp. PastM-2]MDF9857909.1 hypothetical protein [Paenibacillus sp. PastF-1]MDH6483176.1 hypothetical protein [Paenibacillus sp. PastH-2]MDH6510568.1 hypothetical protein [Paenibacillus sp. PastM-3]